MAPAETHALLMPIFPTSFGNGGWILRLGKVESLIYGAVNPPVTRTKAVKKLLEWLHRLSYTST